MKKEKLYYKGIEIEYDVGFTNGGKAMSILDPMHPMTLLHEAVEHLQEASARNNKARVDKDEEIEATEKVPAVHASELGACPLYLYRKFSGKADIRDWSSADRDLFLHDGFVHEEATAMLLELSAHTDYEVKRGLSIGVSVCNNRALLIGTSDIVLADGREILVVYEHKAVKQETFDKYVADPSTVPNHYIVQCAVYTVYLGSKYGMVLIKNRNNSKFFPDPAGGEWFGNAPLVYTLDECKEIVDRHLEQFGRILDGDVDLIGGPEKYASDSCQWCPCKKQCFPNAHGVVKPSETYEADDELAKTITAARWLKTAADKYDTLYKAKRKTLRTVMDLHGWKKVTSPNGSATMTPGRLRQTPFKADVDKCIEEGHIRVSETQGDSYVTIRGKKAKKVENEKKDTG